MSSNAPASSQKRGNDQSDADLDQPAKKRVKLDASKEPEASTGQTRAIERHKTFYFEDGNIVLIATGAYDLDSDSDSDSEAEVQADTAPQPSSVSSGPTIDAPDNADAQETVEAQDDEADAEPPFISFRVHRSVLSRESTVFKDMFSFPPTDEVEKWDDTPCVYVSDVPAHLESLLTSLYRGFDYLKSVRDDRTYTEALEGALILSKKYMMDSVFDAIATYLEDYWPRTLREWDRLDSSISLLRARFSTDPQWPDSEISELVLDPAQSAYLARLAGLPHVLPAALYDLTRIEHFKDDHLEDPSSDKRCATWDKLGREDLWALKIGRERMVEHFRNAANLNAWGLPVPRMECLTSTTTNDIARTEMKRKCNAAHALFWSRLVKKCIEETRDPLALLGEWEECRLVSPAEFGQRTKLHKPTCSEDICATCMSFVRDEVLELRQEIWDRLPVFFDIKIRKGWNETNKVKQRYRKL